MPRRIGQRQTLPSERLTHPQFGARHKIPYQTDNNSNLLNEELDFFFSDLRRELAKVLPSEVITIEETPPDGSTTHEPWRRERPRFRVYDDPDRLRLTIFERRLTTNNANHNRIQWTRQDVGRIRGDIQNEISRSDLADMELEAKFVTAVRLPSNVDNEKARKIGLVLEQDCDLAEFLIREHEICFDGLSGSMDRRFNRSIDTFVPHWTVARIDRNVGMSALNKSVRVVQNLLPLTVQIEPISFYSHQDLDDWV